MVEQLPFYEDKQQEAWEDYQNLVNDRDDLRRQLAECREENGNMDSMYQDRLLDFEGMAYKAEEQLAEVTAERDRLQSDYMDLIMSVAKKFPGETRHQTALRYIRENESKFAPGASQGKREVSDNGISH